MAPSVLEYEVKVQEEHVSDEEARDAVLYLPFSQSEHIVAPSFEENLPGSQSRQLKGVAPPEVLPYLPAWQEVQPDSLSDPAVSPYFPSKHWIQATSLSAPVLVL